MIVRPALPVHAHAGDQSFDLGVDGRAPSGGPAGELEEAISSVRSRPGRRSLVDGELVAKGQVLEGELAVAVDEKGGEGEAGGAGG